MSLAEEEYAQDFETIRSGLLRISELEDEISSLEGTRICAECGAKVEKGAASAADAEPDAS